MLEPFDNELRHLPDDASYDPEDEAFGDYEPTEEEILRASMSIHRWEDWIAESHRKSRVSRKTTLPADASPIDSASNDSEHHNDNQHVAIEALSQRFEQLLEEGQRLLSDVRGLSSEAQEIAESALLGWQGELLATVLTEEVAALKEERRIYDLAIASGPGELVSDDQAAEWCKERLGALMESYERLGEFVSANVRPALASQDPELIAHRARQLVLLYKDQLEWSCRLRGARASDKWMVAFQELSWFNKHAVVQLAGLPRTIRSALSKARQNPPDRQDCDRVIVPLTIELRSYNSKAFGRALNAALKDVASS